MKSLLAAALALIVMVSPAAADEFTDTLESALKAYRDGDIKAAGEDLDYAGKLLGSQKSAELAGMLPAAPAGWTKTADTAEEAGIGMAIFGGGTTAAATYSDGKDDVKITLVADSPMVSGLGTMISGVTSLAGGKPLRIQRTEFTNNNGELQGVVGDKVMVSVAGSATIEQKTALLEAMDFKALGDY